MKTKGIYIHILLLLLFVACGHRRQETVVTPWGEVADSIPDDDDSFDLEDIQSNGELIALTMTGPETYYDYRGRHLGTHYLLCQRFADQLGVSLRVEVCRDTAEMRRRLTDGDADLAILPSSLVPHGQTRSNRSPLSNWRLGSDKDDLARELAAWYQPAMLDEVRRSEQQLLAMPSVQRRVFSPMLDRAGGVISHYDAFFQRYAPQIRWDWRLLAAQCYQESCFDPQAKSWAGACGLMQIMPATADHLGLARNQIYDPEQNIAAAVRYIAELEESFADIRDRSERTKFVLAAYNGGGFHIRDAMALARKYGRSGTHWREVEPYVLKLSEPKYYNDPVVSNGYMRGSETVDYVRRIHDRWNGYRGVKVTRQVSGPLGVPQKATHERKKKFQVY